MNQSKHPLIVFDHLAYTGGLTAAYEMEKLFSVGETLHLAPGAEREVLQKLASEELSARKLIAGHSVFGLLNESDFDVRYITMLRHPVNRFLSHYYWWKLIAKGEVSSEYANVIEVDLAKNTDSLDIFLDEYLKQVENFQWSQLYYLLHRHIPEKDISGKLGDNIYQPDVIPIVENELESAYDLVLITELFEESMVLFSSHYGRAYPSVFNKITYSKVKWDELDCTLTAVEKIKHICRFELQVYESARARFEARISPLLDENFLKYKTANILNDRKFLRHFMHGSDTYIHSKMSKNTSLGKLLRDQVVDSIYSDSKARISVSQPLTEDINLFDKANNTISFMIWGTSLKYQQDYQSLLTQCDNGMFLGFIDNDKSKWNSIVDGYPVFAPNDCIQEGLRPKAILIASEFVEEISSQIKSEISYAPEIFY